MNRAKLSRRIDAIRAGRPSGDPAELDAQKCRDEFLRLLRRLPGYVVLLLHRDTHHRRDDEPIRFRDDTRAAVERLPDELRELARAVMDRLDGVACAVPNPFPTAASAQHRTPAPTWLSTLPEGHR